MVRETQFQAYKENKDALFSSATVPETPLENTSANVPETPLQESGGFQLVSNRKRRREMLQNLAVQDNEPMPDAHDVYSDSDGKLNTMTFIKDCAANCNIFLSFTSCKCQSCPTLSYIFSNLHRDFYSNFI